MVGLTLFHRAAVYTDPSDPIAAVCFQRILTVDRGTAPEGAVAAGRRNFYGKAIVLHPPEVKGPLFWSVLGVTALCCSAFIPGISPFSRLGPILAGGVLPLGTWALALNNYTLRICVDASGLRPNRLWAGAWFVGTW